MVLIVLQRPPVSSATNLFISRPATTMSVIGTATAHQQRSNHVVIVVMVAGKQVGRQPGVSVVARGHIPRRKSRLPIAYSHKQGDECKHVLYGPELLHSSFLLQVSRLK